MGTSATYCPLNRGCPLNTGFTVYVYEITSFFVLWFFTQNNKKNFRDLLSRLSKVWNLLSLSCVPARCMILMFSKSLSQCFYHSGVLKTDHPYTFKSSTVGSQTMQPFSCCIIEQITLKTSKKCIKQFCFRLLILKFEGWCSLSRNTTPCLLTLPRCML